MDIVALIENLQRQGFQLTPRGDKLAVSPASKLTPELTDLLRAYKPEIIRLLRAGLVPAKKKAMVLYHQDPAPCAKCGHNVWWITLYYTPVCQSCSPAPSRDVVLEWMKPQGL